MRILKSSQYKEIKDRIHELEQLHDLGDNTYTDTFELEELRNQIRGCWHVVNGGGQTTPLKYFTLDVIVGSADNEDKEAS